MDRISNLLLCSRNCFQVIGRYLNYSLHLREIKAIPNLITATDLFVTVTTHILLNQGLIMALQTCLFETR